MTLVAFGPRVALSPGGRARRFGKAPMRMTRALLALLALLANIGTPREAAAVILELSNPSFEVYDIGIDGAYVDASIGGWVTYPAGFYNGLQDPLDAQYPGATGSPGTIPGGSGDQFVWLQNTGVIYQDVSGVLNPGFNLLQPLGYRLTVAVGDRLDNANGPYTIQLLAGGNVLASVTDSSTSLPSGVFTDVVLTYIASSSDPHLGQQLRVRLASDPVLTGAGSQVNFDDVELEWFVPEPGTVLLLGLGGLLAAWWRRRR